MEQTIKTTNRDKTPKITMEIDPRDMPSPEATEPINKEIVVPKAEEPTPKKEAPIVNDELEALKIKNLELQKQKEHWREKYDRDITNKPVDEIPEDLMSDEGKALKGHISALKEEISSMKEKAALDSLSVQYPAIKDKMNEFLEFKADYPKTGLDKIAKLFLLENGLLDSPKPRIGLEKPSGGSKGSTTTGISQDDVKRLRQDSPRLYEKMLRTGKLNPEDIQ